MEPAAASGARILWIDIARGLGILLVVAGHVERGLVSAGVATASAWAGIDLAIYSFHMALFMLLAGLNVPRTFRRGRGPFLIGKVRSVYHPYLVWSAIQGGLLLLVSGAANSAASWSDLVQIPWRPIMQFWFLYVLMAYLLLVTLTGMQRWLLILLGVAAIAANMSLESLSLLNRLLFYLPFFIAGALLGEHLDSVRRPALISLGILTALWAAALALVMPRDPLAHLGLAALPCAVLGTLAILGLAHHVEGRAALLLAWIGQRSLSIFVMHILASAATRIALLKFVPDAPELLYFAAGMTAGVLLPCLALGIAHRAGIAAWLGLEKRSAGALR
ncbi:acyltransferase family protein [Sphingomonas sp. R647]|uniref:acyltransferase family protein n=1 Tax=Sphingomonas sp. R647 TaxID=2875233 RepID=UPI001CD4D66B|nr:acyltransferase family protein [Sphingomonas sp. R647]MCA1196349.1 acyltransferase family protein [Sphingomonas sp. R647]